MTEWYEELGIKEHYYADDNVCIIHGDCRELSLPGISAVVTDPPYELGFMGKSWDSKGVSFQKETWEKIKSYCLPGAPLLSFGGSRTQHRIACAIEDAGWEVRDTLMYVYGSGFPKSLDISRAIDKVKNAEREIIGLEGRRSTYDGKERASQAVNTNWRASEGRSDVRDNAIRVLSMPSTSEAKLWNGYGTALKPAYEPIILAMNPLDKTFANNALKYGVAGLNIDECRVPVSENSGRPKREVHALRDGVEYHPNSLAGRVDGSLASSKAVGVTGKGRFPANLIHDGSQEVLELFPDSKKSSASGYNWGKGAPSIFMGNKSIKSGVHFGDSGSAARFFYTAKASKSERGAANNHPTVKPLALMEYLCKLVKMPEYNLILDPFCGSGTTLLACMKLGTRAIGIDSDEQSCEIAAIRYLKAQSEVMA